jgi:PAS domain S-box-containing protein
MVQDPNRFDASPVATAEFNPREQQLLVEIAELQLLVAQLQQRNDLLRQAESALQERETQFQVLVEHSQDIIYVHSLDGVFNYISPSIQIALGYAPGQLVGKSFLDIIHSDDIGRCWNLLESIQRTHEPHLGQAFRLRHNDRSWRWFVTNITPIVDEQDQITAYQGIARNVTERFEAENAQRKAQDQVKSAHDFLRNVLDQVPDPIFVKDHQGKFILVNQAFCHLFGLIPQQALGRFNHDLLPPELARTFQNLDQLVLSTSESQMAETLYEYQDNQKQLLLTRQALYQDAKNGQFIVGSIRNLTDEQNTKLALDRANLQLIKNEKMSSLGIMVAGIAHEIKNPLGFVIGNLPLLNRDIGTLLQIIAAYREELPEASPRLEAVLRASDLDFLQQDLPKLLDSITHGTGRMQDIVQSLQNFSHQDTDRFQRFQLEEGLESTLLILKPRTKANEIRPEIQIQRQYAQSPQLELPPIECHPGQINQVFMNLLSNAIDALESRYTEGDFAPQITIQTEVQASQVLVRISDNGTGVSAINQARLFRETFTTKPIGKGTGMGLSITHKIITAHHGGQLECASVWGEGTVFTIALPIKQREQLENK